MTRLDELLTAEPLTSAGASKLRSELRGIASKIDQRLHEDALSEPVPTPGLQLQMHDRRALLVRIDAKVEMVGARIGVGVILGPAFEQHVLERLLEEGGLFEKGIAERLKETDAWDVAGWADGAAEQGLIERVDGGFDETPRRRWQITDKGRKEIGYPAGR
jgi:hypothetical protein